MNHFWLIAFYLTYAVIDWLYFLFFELLLFLLWIHYECDVTNAIIPPTINNGKAMYSSPPITIPINITGKKITVQSNFIIPQDAFNPNIKNFPTNQIIQIANNNDNIFYSFWNSFWYVSFIFSVLFLINIQMCSLYQAYYWMPDFSPSFLLSGLIEFSVLLPSDHPIYILFFVDIVTITNLFFIIHIHHEELHLYISRILRILSLYFSARIVFYLCWLFYNKHIRAIS